MKHLEVAKLLAEWGGKLSIHTFESLSLPDP